MIKVGTAQLKTAAPDNLGGQLLALTGLSPAEVRRQLESPCIAGTVAAALLPFLVEKPTLAALARQIAEAGVRDVQRRVHRLYTGKLTKADPAPQELTVATYCDAVTAGDVTDPAAMRAFRDANAEAIEAEFARRNEAAMAAQNQGGASGPDA